MLKRPREESGDVAAPPSKRIAPDDEVKLLANQLEHVIGVSTQERVRALLINVLRNEGASVRDYLRKQLLVDEREYQPWCEKDDRNFDSYESEEPSDNDSGSNEDSTPKPERGDKAIFKPNSAPRSDSTKLHQRYVTCERCDGTFDLSKNKSGDCQWHDGEILSHFRS